MLAAWSQPCCPRRLLKVVSLHEGCMRHKSQRALTPAEAEGFSVVAFIAHMGCARQHSLTAWSHTCCHIRLLRRLCIRAAHGRNRSMFSHLLPKKASQNLHSLHMGYAWQNSKHGHTPAAPEGFAEVVVSSHMGCAWQNSKQNPKHDLPCCPLHLNKKPHMETR